LSLPALFSVEHGAGSAGTALWAAASVFFYATAYSAFNVPYMAMAAEMSVDAGERARLMSFRVAAIGIGQLLAGTLAPVIIARAGGGASGHWIASWVLAPIVLAACWTAWFATRGARFTTAPAHSASGIRAQFEIVRSNRPFMVLMLVKLLLLSAIAVGTATLAMYTFHVLRRSDSLLGALAFANAAGIIVSMLGWRRWITRSGAVRAFGAAALLYACVSLTFLLASPATATALLLFGAFVQGCASGGLLLVGQILLPEAIDVDRRRSGLNREGIYSGVYSTVERVAFALGLTAAGVILGLMGYESGSGLTHASQSAQALLAVRFCTWCAPAFLVLASAWALQLFDSSEQANATSGTAMTPVPTAADGRTVDPC
jgi:GPH family glycoside/pentoside/hexuronide:cation symporter